MGKTKFCRICRTAENLKYTTKELRQLNKEQLLLAQATQQGHENKASKKLLLTTPTLGNICQICNERIQIFHRLDDGDQESNSDVEIEVVSESVPINMVEAFSNRDVDQRTQRPETPVIVDDDDMLFNIFMQKFDQKMQLTQNQICSSFSQQQMNKQFTNQFHSTYTPPQSTGGSSEGDESKVIEVLTSRESSPAPIRPSLTCNSKLVDPQGHRIVAIIELDDGDDDEKQDSGEPNALYTVDKSISNDFSGSKNAINRPVSLPSFTNPCKGSDTSQSVYVDDDEEIVFRKVDNEKAPVLKKRERKTYDDKKLRLVACLDLVSSDSETEDISVTEQLENVSNGKLSVPLAVKKTFICNVCEQKFPNFESLSVHERVHQGVKCTLCLIGFQQVKRLIHHMRRKHREYNGDVLSEKPRSGQDSCMTIRLRYMQHTTFYECQLCGRIDDVFREHKEHILEKHPNESKSLKDPIMKQLKCPVCKIKCGIQYLSLCRHLINSHEYQEYKSHLRELVHVSAFGWNVARQQEVAKTAKIFQFVKRKTFFFECKICSKIVAGYLHHLRHVNEHKKTSDINIKTASNEIFERSPPLASLNTSNLDKLCKTLNKDGVCISKKLRKRDNLSKKFVSHTNIKNKIKQFEKGVKVSKKKPKLDDNCCKTNKPNLSQNIKNTVKILSCKQSKVEPNAAVSNKIQLKNQCKPKDKKVAKLPDCAVSAKGKFKKESDKKANNLKKQKSKMKLIELKQQKKKVKVKATTRQIDLQNYKCKYCLKKFKGFRLYNLHLLKQHQENEFSMCDKCNKFFTSASNFEEHMKQCPKAFAASKRKRKFFEKSSLSENINESYQPFSNKVPRTSDVSSTYLEDNYVWLKDLIKLKQPKEMNYSNLSSQQATKTAFLNLQCCYCLHFLSNDKNLKEHKEIHHLQTSDILIKYKPFRNL